MIQKNTTILIERKKKNTKIEQFKKKSFIRGQRNYNNIKDNQQANQQSGQQAKKETVKTIFLLNY